MFNGNVFGVAEQIELGDALDLMLNRMTTRCNENYWEEY